MLKIKVFATFCFVPLLCSAFPADKPAVDMTVNREDSVTLPCNASTNASTASIDDVRWTQTDDEGLTYSIYKNWRIHRALTNRLHIKTNTFRGDFSLVINRAEQSDAGLYVCSELSTTGQETILQRYNVFVTNRTEATPIFVKSEETLTLPCNSSSSPCDVEVRWTQKDSNGKKYDIYRDWDILSSLRNRLFVSTTVRGEYNLVITQVKRTNAGQYVCSEWTLDGQESILQRYLVNITAEEMSTTKASKQMTQEATPASSENNMSTSTSNQIAITFSILFAIAACFIVAVAALTCPLHFSRRCRNRFCRRCYGETLVNNNNDVTVPMLTLTDPVDENDDTRWRWPLKEKQKFVRGLAIIDNYVYVLRVGIEPKIEKYVIDERSSVRPVPTFQDEWSISNASVHLQDLVAWKTRAANYLFTCDVLHKAIIRLNTSIKKNITRWKFNGTPWGLFIVHNKHLLVTFKESSTIVQLDEEGVERRRIQTSPEINFPRHAVQISDEKYVVCQGSLGEVVHRVSLMNFETKRKIGHFLGSVPGRVENFDEPCHMAVDSDKNVIVVDRGNARVVLLSQQLLWLDVLATGVIDSHKIAYSKKHELIFVAQWYGNTVTIIRHPRHDDAATSSA